MKGPGKLWMIISLLILGGCSIYLKNQGSLSDVNTYYDSDTLVFKSFSKKTKIDSVICLDSTFVVKHTSFNLPASIITPEQTQFKALFYLSDGRVKKLQMEVKIVADEPPVEVLVEEVRTLPHNETFFTQGLEVHKGWLYESAGRYGESSLNKINLQSGEMIYGISLDSALFAEGLTFKNDTLYLLTWKEKQMLKFNERLSLPSRQYYPRDGWGICNAGSNLVTSDGSDQLFFLEPDKCSTVKTITVYDHSGTIRNLNELEWVDGLLWANVLGQEYILVINPGTGRVLFKLDFSAIIDEYNLWSVGAFNGIAWQKETGEVVVTGKNWPYYFIFKVPDIITEPK